MTAQPLSHPQGVRLSAPDPAEDMDLDTRIGLVEGQLIAREQRLLSAARGLQQRAKQAIEPRSLLLKLGGALVAGGGLVWALRRGASTGAPARQHAPAALAGAPPQLLLSLLPMAWPMLPARWRNRVSPATAATVIGLVVPVMQRLLAPRAASDTDASERHAPPTVARLDMLRFAGAWHEQARLPASSEQAGEGRLRATYTPQGTGLAVHHECRSGNGKLRLADGVARVVPGSGGARFQVSFMPGWLQWLPVAWADLWVLHVDETAPDYRVAIVGHPTRKGLRLLSRSEYLPSEELQRLVAAATDLGYDTSRLVIAEPEPTATQT